MSRPVFVKSFVGDGQWHPLATTPTVLTVTITVDPANVGTTEFRVDGGVAVPWPAGVSNTLVGVDLSRIEVKSPAGDVVLVVGGIRSLVARTTQGNEPGGGGGDDS